MDKMILLSIIVPVYNVEAYLKRCLDSLVPQLCDEIEVLIIDDCSQDGSSTIYKEYESNYSQIRSIRRKENGKISMARNTGIAHARGQYCWFVDSDDKIDDNAIVGILDDIKTKMADTFFYSFSKVSSNIEKRYDTTNQQISLSNQMIKKDFINKVVCCKYGYEIWNKIFSTEILKKYEIEFPRGISYGEDIAFIIVYLQYAKSVTISNRRIYFYMIREDSMMGRAKTVSHLIDMYYNAKYVFDKINDKERFYLIFCKLMQEGMIQSWKIDLYDNINKIADQALMKKMTSECLRHPFSILLAYKKRAFKMYIFCIMIEAVIHNKKCLFMKLRILANIH